MTTANILSQLGSAGVSTAFKNRLINGQFPIWQRGTSFSPAQYGYVYTADRWFVFSALTSGNLTVSQSTSVPASTSNIFPYSIKVQRNSASTSTGGVNLYQIIESNNMYDLAGQSVTLSFWIKCGANYTGGGLQGALVTGTVADQGSANIFSWTGTAYPASLTVTPTTTWTKYSVTGTIASNALELAIAFLPTGFAGTAGADDSFSVTGVQLEVGTTATNFDYRPYGTEFNLCQRYYQQYNSFTAYFSYAQGYTPTTTASQFFQPLQVYMRTTPSLVASAAANFQILQFSTTATVSVVGLSTATPYSLIYSTTNSTLNVNTLAVLRDAGSNNSYIAANAEL
jgi:hypothetical protein